MRKPHTPALTWTGYVAVRQSPQGHEWLDISTISSHHEAVARYAAETEAQTPVWAQANPVVEIRHCALMLRKEVPHGRLGQN